MKALIRFDEERNTLIARMNSSLSRRELSEFFIRSASLLFGRIKKSAMITFQDDSPILCDSRQLSILFRGFEKLNIRRVALTGVPSKKRGTIYGILESVLPPAHNFMHEFFDSQDEAFLWLQQKEGRCKKNANDSHFSKVEIEELFDINHQRRRKMNITPDSEPKDLETRFDYLKGKS